MTLNLNRFKKDLTCVGIDTVPDVKRVIGEHVFIGINTVKKISFNRHLLLPKIEHTQYLHQTNFHNHATPCAHKFWIHLDIVATSTTAHNQSYSTAAGSYISTLLLTLNSHSTCSVVVVPLTFNRASRWLSKVSLTVFAFRLASTTSHTCDFHSSPLSTQLPPLISSHQRQS